MGRNGSWLYLYQYKSVINDEGVLKVAGVRCPQRAWAGGVNGEGRGVASNGGGVGGITKVREVSAARAEVSAAMAEEQVSGVDNEHGQEVSTVRVEVSAAMVEVSEVSPRCRRCRR